MPTKDIEKRRLAASQRQERYRIQTDVMRKALHELRIAWIHAADLSGMPQLADGLDDLSPTDLLAELTARIQGNRLKVLPPERATARKKLKVGENLVTRVAKLYNLARPEARQLVADVVANRRFASEILAEVGRIFNDQEYPE